MTQIKRKKFALIVFSVVFWAGLYSILILILFLAIFTSFKVDLPSILFEYLALLINGLVGSLFIMNGYDNYQKNKLSSLYEILGGTQSLTLVPIWYFIEKTDMEVIFLLVSLILLIVFFFVFFIFMKILFRLDSFIEDWSIRYNLTVPGVPGAYSLIILILIGSFILIFASPYFFSLFTLDGEAIPYYKTLQIISTITFSSGYLAGTLEERLGRRKPNQGVPVIDTVGDR